MQTAKLLLFGLLLLASPYGLSGQAEAPAPWIAYPTANTTGYGVFHFRKAVSLDSVPAELLIHVSADNRYNLFVNGQRVAYGPAKGDLQTYKYDIVDLAPYLQPGTNQLAALVYNAGKDKPMAFLSAQTAFMLRPAEPRYHFFSTANGWRAYRNPAYQPVTYQEMLFDERWFYGYYACGPGDRLRADLYPWGWEAAGFDDSLWPPAERLHFEGRAPWQLVPRNIPFMDDFIERPARIRLVEGMDQPLDLQVGRTSITVPPRRQVKILYDYNVFTMGYPELTVTGGRGSSIRIKYAEALYEGVNLKAHRDSVAGKTMYGVWDEFYPDGQATRTFRPLWKRAFRYVQLVVRTGEEPLEILNLRSEYSGYPYPEMASFNSDDSRLNAIFEMGLRTLRLCSGETYYDTPYYEQLSYGGDNRPIAALSIYNSNDDQLLREVLRLYPQSENPETGLFKSAYPSRFNFDMGSWSLAWIQGLHDYYYLRGDSAFVRPFVGKIEGVLRYFQQHTDESVGLLGTVDNQNFIDWSITKGSIPRANERREMTHSALLTLYYAHTLDCTVRLFRQLGLNERAAYWAAEAARLKSAVYRHCWNEETQLLSDYPGQPVYSQHTNLLAILCDVVAPGEQQALLERILTYEGFTEYASAYFSFFLFKAMEKTGQQKQFFDALGFWEEFLARGHTTTGETGFESHDRSDCHAWSAHPAYYLLSLVCGIQPDTIGFGKVRIAPELGPLTAVQASMPHPRGRISVEYYRRDDGLEAVINLPEGLSGVWQHEGEEIALQPGLNIIN